MKRKNKLFTALIIIAVCILTSNIVMAGFSDKLSADRELTVTRNRCSS